MTNKMKFREWERQVAREVHAIAGVSLWDMGDFMTRDMFDDGYTPHEAAREILVEQGY